MSQNLGLIRYRKIANRASHFALKWPDAKNTSHLFYIESGDF